MHLCLVAVRVYSVYAGVGRSNRGAAGSSESRFWMDRGAIHAPGSAACHSSGGGPECGGGGVVFGELVHRHNTAKDIRESRVVKRRYMSPGFIW